MVYPRQRLLLITSLFQNILLVNPNNSVIIDQFFIYLLFSFPPFLIFFIFLFIYIKILDNKKLNIYFKDKLNE